MNKIVELIDVDQILTNPNQPRISFDEVQISELAESINENGLIQPVIVRKTTAGYELVAGERRLRATKSLKIEKIEAIVENYDEVTSARLSIIENIQRENLTPIEEANAYEKLITEYGYTQRILAEKLGKSQSTIANKLRLLNLNEIVKTAILNKEITERHGRALLKIDTEKQELILNKIKEDNLNVAQAEQLIERQIEPKIRKNKVKPVITKVDYRLELNTIIQAIKVIESSGVSVKYDTSEDEEGFLIQIRLKK